ncbi:M15 family metallopeptidase [Cyanobacterium aponinum UTEX 3222]|uniref:M15 family metallopeptidase n=1 Tax=Cyanobacterium aponinum TaxID=379064 RepID=UPI003086A84E|nr:M15 family metallopeptidase [Cyanobacterium aponinum UTEX 3222]
MKPYQKIIIHECGEPLMQIPEQDFYLETPSAYARLGADYQGKSPYFLRAGVLDKLLIAKEELKKINPHWKIRIFDAYRPVSIQKFMVEYTFNSICKEREINVDILGEEEKEKIYQEVFKIWAIPSDNPLTPPPHSTGGAIDLTIMDENKQSIPMGGEIDELSLVSLPDYYLNARDEPEKTYHQHRQILLQIMTKAGFHRHREEWWHFSYGDQMWAWLENEANPQSHCIAKYGKYEQ